MIFGTWIQTFENLILVKNIIRLIQKCVKYMSEVWRKCLYIVQYEMELERILIWNICCKRGETSVEEGRTLAEGTEDIPQGYLGKDQQRVKVLHVQVIDWLIDW